MTQKRIRTDLRIVRAVLDAVDAGTPDLHIAREFNIVRSNIPKWIRRREAVGRADWPNPQDITEWDADEAENRERRDRRAKAAYEYRKRVYLNRGPVQLPAIGTTRRIQALMALGWTTRDIGDHMGVTPQRVSHLALGTFPTLFPSTVASVAAVFEALCMTVPDDPTPTKPREVRIHARTRRRALRMGYLPPLAWDDIDDPNEVPNVAPVKRETAGAPDLKPDRVEDLEWMADHGENLTNAAARLQLTEDALHAVCRRAGRLDLYARLADREADGDNRRATRRGLQRQAA